MSKMDDMRAMREARYGAATPAAKRTTAPKPQVPERTSTAAGTSADEASEDGVCGHRAISGRTCTREKGHAAKSHRYS